MELRRRDLLKLGFFGSAALMLPAERIARTKDAFGESHRREQAAQAVHARFVTPPVLAPERRPHVRLLPLDQIEKQVEILPGLKTPIWGYNGIVAGPDHQVDQRAARWSCARSTSCRPKHPTLRYNVWTSTHLHGSASLPQYDGYASDITNPGQCKDYRYPNDQNARTLWYHDHGVHHTAQNAYMGLAAHVPSCTTRSSSALPIPHGRYDVPLDPQRRDVRRRTAS